MSDPVPSTTGETVSTHLTGTLLASVKSAETKAKRKGVSKSELIADAIKEGLPAVIKRLNRRKDRLATLKEAVEAVVSEMPGDITRTKVIEALRRDHAAVLVAYNQSTLSANVSAYLRRLVDREVLKENGTAEEPGPKGLRNYQVNVYRRNVKMFGSRKK